MHLTSVQEANRRFDAGEHPSMMRYSAPSGEFFEDIVEAIFAAPTREDSEEIIETYSSYWMEIVGTRGFKGKKALNSRTMANKHLIIEGTGVKIEKVKQELPVLVLNDNLFGKNPIFHRINGPAITEWYENGNKKYYICPRYWNVIEERSVSQKEVDDNHLQKHIVTKEESYDPENKNKFILDLTSPLEHFKTGSYNPYLPGFLKTLKTKSGQCLPCCFTGIKGKGKDGDNFKNYQLFKKEQEGVI
jgi:hypothetical protein